MLEFFSVYPRMALILTDFPTGSGKSTVGNLWISEPSLLDKFQCRSDPPHVKYNYALLLPTARKGNVFTVVCLSTIGLMDTDSLLGLVTARSVRILLECFLVFERNLFSIYLCFQIFFLQIIIINLQSETFDIVAFVGIHWCSCI